MRLYLDDDLTWRWLAGLLRNAGHDVRLPSEAGLAGAKDAAHLTRAVQEGRVCLTRNYNDFELLHELIMAVGGHHPGILILRQEKDRKKNLRPHEVVRAIHNLEAANYVLADRCEVLNHWR